MLLIPLFVQVAFLQLLQVLAEQWAGSGTSIAQTLNATGTIGGTATYTITPTLGACVGIPISVIVNVNPLPTVVATPTSQTLCSGAITGISLSSIAGTTFSWTATQTGISGAASSSGNSIAQTLTSTGVTTGTATYTITPTLGTCIGTSISTLITVNPNPVITVNSGNFCAGGNLVLTAAGATSYSWSSEANLSSSTGSTVTASPNFTSTYTVTGTTLGCSGTATSTVTVKPNPVSTVSNNGPFCFGDILNLTTVNGNIGATFAWTGPDSFTSTLQNPSIASLIYANAGLYSLTTTLNGCTSFNSSNVVINTGTSTAIVPIADICSNSSQFNFTAENPNGVWSGTAINSAGTFDPSLAVLGANTITYNISGSCSSPSSFTFNMLQASIVNFTSDKTEGCSPLRITFTDNSTPVGVSQNWIFGNGTNSSGINSVGDFLTPGFNTVTLISTSANGCFGAQTILDYIEVYDNPEISFTADQTETIIYNPSFEFTNTSSGAIDYVWDFGNNSVPIAATNAKYTYENAGNYIVTLIGANLNGCLDSATLIVKVTDELLFFIPNTFTPNGDEFNNEFKPIITSFLDVYNFEFKIYNRWGEIVFETKDAKYGWDGTYKGIQVQDGNYAWKIKYQAKDSDQTNEKSGTLVIIK